MKIFCIGFNKTGTSSLHELFVHNGLKSKHNIRWPHYSHITAGKLYFTLYDAYSDGERSNFVRLHKWFPDAFFIFNDRDEQKWIRSRLHHYFNHINDEEPTVKNFFIKKQYGFLVPEMKICPEKAIDYWVTNYRLYKELSLNYFADEKRFLHLHVTEDIHWQDKLELFFKSNDIKISKTDGSTSFNKSPSKIVMNPHVEEYMSYYIKTWVSKN